jgi:hypothetical protein
MAKSFNELFEVYKHIPLDEFYEDDDEVVIA